MQLGVLDGLVSDFVVFFALLGELLDLRLTVCQRELEALHAIDQAKELLCVDASSGCDWG